MRNEARIDRDTQSELEQERKPTGDTSDSSVFDECAKRHNEEKKEQERAEVVVYVTPRQPQGRPVKVSNWRSSTRLDRLAFLFCDVEETRAPGGRWRHSHRFSVSC